MIFTKHAIERAWERYGLALLADDAKYIWNCCRNGHAPRMGIDERGSVHLLNYRGRMIAPVIAKDSGAIVTFLPAEAFLKSYRKRFRDGALKQKFKSAKNAMRGTKGGKKPSKRALVDMAGDA